jgi:spore germination protein KC
VLVNVRNRRSTIKPEIRNGKPHIAVRIQLEANLLEKSNEAVRLNTNVIKQAENTFNKTSGKAYVGLIKQTQEKGSDIFAFGERIRAKYPQYWNQHIKTKENWEKLYKDLTVEVTVDSHIRRIGMKAT